jgi:twinkle protein
MAAFVQHEPCPKCGSSNNLARYADGSATCFTAKDMPGACGYYEKGDGTIPSFDDAPSSSDWTPLDGDVIPLPKRGLKRETLEHWRYQSGTYNGQPCQIANHFEDGKLVVQKLRLPNKEFRSLGADKHRKNMSLYGKHLCKGSGKYLTITEGEHDAHTMSQVFDLKWDVVSLPNGTGSVDQVIRKDYEFICGYDNVILMFDMDEPGRAAAEKAASMLPPGKVKVAELPGTLKDPNEVLLSEEHGAAALVRAFWNAKPWRPDGIKTVSELRQEFFNPPPLRGIEFPWQSWNETIGLMRIPSLITFTAGTGIGKTTLLRELVVHLLEKGEPVAGLFLEDDIIETMENLVSVRLSKNITLDRALATAPELEGAFTWFEKQPLFLYDHFGSSDVDNICAKIRYLVQACGVRWVFLDHISILVSGLEGDERRTIDMAMTKLRTLVNEVRCCLCAVVHLRRPQGDRGHEDGAEVRLGQLRGSHSIAQLSDVVIAGQKPEDDPQGNVNEWICLKNRRNGGKKGSMGVLTYDREQGRLTDCVF